MAFTSGVLSWRPLGVIWLEGADAFWLVTLMGTGMGLRSFNIVATGAWNMEKNIEYRIHLKPIKQT